MLKISQNMPNFIKYNELLIKKQFYNQKIRYLSPGFTRNSPAYLMTTENINGYYDLFDFKDKDILTVIGSSDFIFNAIIKDSKKIDAFDVSMYAIVFYYLKEAAIKTLTHAEYIKFFYDYNDSFDKKVYFKIKEALNQNIIPFWDLVFSLKNPRELIISSFFIQTNNRFIATPETIKKFGNVSAYLNYEKYSYLKQKIEKCLISLYLADVKELNNIGNTYDYIILSNIMNYQNRNQFYQMIENYLNKLNENGEIISAYLYSEPKEEDFKRYSVVEIPSYIAAMNNNYSTSHYVLIKKKTF